MTRALTHRGPDDEGYLSDDRISLGMRRLAIVDLQSGRQPLSNETGEVWTVFNGEIYNHKELRQALMAVGHRFATDHADTEVIVHLFEEYGEEWVRRINGMFGLAVWDKVSGILRLYRDRLGKKPLYYALKNGQLIFGSEIKAVLAHPAVSREFDYPALYRYFGLKSIPAPHTAYLDIRQLPPGHVLTWRAGNIRVRPYWQPDFQPFARGISEEDAAAELMGLLEDAVRIRMDCDVPYGAYLSGGLDSSLVTSLMSRRQAHPVVTFCLGYADEVQGQFVGKAQDSQYARLVSERLGTTHHEYILGADEFAAALPRVLRAFDEPFSGTVSTYFLSILIHRHVKVAISGDGSDELFGSYLTHRLAFPMAHYQELRAAGRGQWDDMTPEDRQGLAPFDTPKQFAFLRSLEEGYGDEWRQGLEVFTRDERRGLLSSQVLAAAGATMDNGGPRAWTARDALNVSLEIDQNGLLPDQVLPFVDRLSMAHSIEVRCPFLDHRVVAFVNRLPGHMKIRSGMNKAILKKAAAGLLPPEIIHRPKEGFVQPIYTWMHDALKPWVRESLAALPGWFFNKDAVRALVAAFERGDPAVNAKIWNLACFGTWYNGTQ